MSLQNRTFLQACRGERPSHTPIWLMRQAGRYLAEYRAIRSKVSFTELCRSPELCAEVTLQPIDRFGFDAAILFSDILVVFDAMGIDVAFNPAPTVASPVRTAADVAKLRFGDLSEVEYVFDAVRSCKRALADRVPLIGFCGAPMTTASYLIEGGGTRDFLQTKSMAFCEPAMFEGLLESITGLLINYLGEQVKAGVDALQIFESWGAAFSPADYERLILPHLRRLVTEAKNHGVPVILFVRGNTELLNLVSDLGADVLGIDWGMEFGHAIDVLGPQAVVQGNLDPIALFAPTPVLENKARAIVETGRRARGHIFNLGHGISRYTDPAAVSRLVEVVHAA